MEKLFVGLSFSREDFPSVISILEHITSSILVDTLLATLYFLFFG